MAVDPSVKTRYSTLSTEPSRARRSSGGGTPNGTRAAASVFFARVMRACTVAVGTRKARAISSLVRPPTARSVSATWDGADSAGWQHRTRSVSVSSWSGGDPAGGSSAVASSRRRRALSLRHASVSRRVSPVCRLRKV